MNNGILSSIKAMPQKDSTSDSTTNFATSRRIYSETINAAPSNAVLKQKKFIGGNRDASSVVARRRAVEVGVGTLNAGATPLSFTTTRDVNVTNNALRRVRAGGGYVPFQKRAASLDPRSYIF
jgi:hypothetical protein